MFIEGIGNATVCIDKVGQTTQTISVLVSGRKCFKHDWECPLNVAMHRTYLVYCICIPIVTVE